MISRIEQSFKRARQQDRAAFVAYLCAGDPDPETSYQACRVLMEEGVDILELGVPFSDPLADGLTNQLAAERALRAGMNQDKVFALVERLRASTDIPIVFYTYYNLVYAHGVQTFTDRAAAVGVDAVLTLDLPPEESAEMDAACAQSGLGTVYIVAPTSPDERIASIAGRATGFLYYVSREGVTGEQNELAEDLQTKVANIRRCTDKPLVVGFGISNAAQVRAVADMADGVVVGSALVKCLASDAGKPGAGLTALRAKAKELISGLAVAWAI